MPGNRKRWTWGILVVLLAVSVALVIIPFLINPDYLKQVALDQIQRTFGPHISIGRTALSLFPHPRIEVTELVVKEEADAHAFFRTQFMSLELQIAPLLRQELVIKELRIDQPEIELKRDRTGQWHLFNTPWAQSETTLLASILSMERVTIVDGQVTVIDESPVEGVRGFVLDNVVVTVLAQGDEVRSANLDISGRIRRPKKDSAFALRGQLGPSPAGLSSPSLRSPPTHPQWQFVGKVNSSNLDLRELIDWYQIDIFPPQMLTTTHARSQVRLLAGQKGYDLILSDFSVKSSLASVTGSANIAGLTAPDPTIAVTFSASPISVRTGYRTILKNRLPREIKEILDESTIGGSIEVIQATVTGSSRSDVGMSVVGTFRLENGSLNRRNIWPKTEQVSGTIVVEPDRIKFDGFTGVYDSLPVRLLQGLIFFKDAGPWMEVDLEGNVPGNKVLVFLAGLSKTNPVFRRLSTWNATKGIGVLTLRFTGFMKGKTGLAFQHGEYVAQNLQISLPEFDNPISNGRGRFRFSPTETSLENVVGRIGGNPFAINGVIKTQGKSTFDGFNLHATLDGQKMIDTWISAPKTEKIMVDGPVALNVTLSGPTVTPRVKGDINLKETALRFPKVLEKAKGVPGSVGIEGGIRSNGTVAFERLELSVLPFRLAGKGAIDLDPVLQVQGRFNTDPIYLGLLPEGVTVGDGILRSGILEVSFNVKGRGDDWRAWKTNGWVALTEGIMDVEDLDVPVTNLYLRLKVDSDVAALQRVEFRMGDSDARFRGTIQNWKNKPEINVVIESSKFDIDLVIPKGDRSPLRDFLESLAGSSTVDGTINIERPRYKDMPLKNLSALLRIHDGLVTVDRIRGESSGGPVAGRVFVHLPENKPAAVRASFDIKGLPFEQLHQSIGHEERLVTGSLFLRGKIQGHGRDPQGVFPTLNGKLDVKIENGHVRRGTILPKILGILNLPTVLQSEVDLSRDGFPFDTLTGELKITNGIVTSENGVIDSPIMKLTTAGNYHLKRDYLDMVAAVSPFGRYSDFMKKIPLFGKILAGERKGLATALFKITGSVEEPEVVYMPMESFATGITGFAQLAVDILTNTVTLPSELLKSDSEDTPARSSLDNDKKSVSPKLTNELP